MIVSWNWLKDYVDLPMTPDELAHRLAMAGLNHESSTAVGDDIAIDLEVTSNRPDCLGHIGVAREVSVLWNEPLRIPDVTLRESKTRAADLTQVRIDCPDLCTRYIARVIHGVKVGPSPLWLARRLESLGIAVVSNIVDVTNYVMMECGQPLHAFDFSKLQGRQIIVRSAVRDEKFSAIDHRSYMLQPGMCVIADANRPVALGGVMGGADSEVSGTTRDLLIEAANFEPLPIRTAARALRLQSPSSYRFERRVDSDGVDWASRRACQLILETAGGELAAGSVDAQPKTQVAVPPIVFRFSQLKRILGIEVPRDEVLRILSALGLKCQASTPQTATLTAPSWRRDLTREIDLVEEVARIHGYDQIPEDVGVPMVPSHRQDAHRVLACVRRVLTACELNEAMTVSLVDGRASSCFSPWTDDPDAEPIQSNMPILRGATCLRRSLIPSLLESRRINESRGNEPIELFETANVYLPSERGLPDERLLMGLTSSRDFWAVKGLLEAILEALHIREELRTEPYRSNFLDGNESARLWLGDHHLGFLGAVGAAGRKLMGLRHPTVVAEVQLAVLQDRARLVPQYQPLIAFPAITRDFNFIVDEQLQWADLDKVVRAAAGAMLEAIDYQETYRDLERDGANRKRLLLTVRLRSPESTLTGEQADAIRKSIIAACQQQLGAALLE